MKRVIIAIVFLIIATFFAYYILSNNKTCCSSIVFLPKSGGSASFSGYDLFISSAYGRNLQIIVVGRRRLNKIPCKIRVYQEINGHVSTQEFDGIEISRENFENGMFEYRSPKFQAIYGVSLVKIENMSCANGFAVDGEKIQIGQEVYE